MGELKLWLKKMAGVYQLLVEIEGIEPGIWRRFKVNDSYNVKDLGSVINYMFDWYGIHLSEFRINNEAYGLKLSDNGIPTDIKKFDDIKLRDLNLASGTKFTYIYDMRDRWEHTITVENHEKGSGLLYPICIGGNRNAPPENCGGLTGYGLLLEVLKDDKHPERNRFMDILEDDWDPEEFDTDLLNTLIRDPNLGIVIDPNYEDN
ncbi:plasmid pRiA4b ORF-3 family protein [Bacteroidota bacterium]